MSNRSKSRSKERTFSPVGSYGQSRGTYSPNNPSPGNITPKNREYKSKPRTRNDQQKNLHSSKTGNAKDIKQINLGSKHQSQNDEFTKSSNEDEPPRPETNSFISQKRPIIDHDADQNYSRATFGAKSTIPAANTTTITIDEYNQLKTTLTNMVYEKENELKRRLNVITNDLNQKTEALSKMRSTLVSQLKELEASFIETNKEYQRSLEIDAILESSHEERGESELTELLEQKRAYEKELDKCRDQLELTQNENSSLKTELEEYSNKFETATNELRLSLAKQKACELENQMKVFERKELEKMKEKLSNEIYNLKQNLIEVEDARKQDKAKLTKEMEEQVLQIRSNDSKQIKDNAKLNEKQKKLEKDLALKISVIDDYRTKLIQAQEENKRLKIENKSLIVTKPSSGFAEAEYADNFADDSDDESNSQFKQKQKEIKNLLEKNPSKATEELYKLWLATTKEFKIQKKDKAKLEDQFDELQEDIKEYKQEERENVEKIIQLEVKVLELEKDNEKLNSGIHSHILSYLTIISI